MRKYKTCKFEILNLYALIQENFDGLWFADYYATQNLKMIPLTVESLSEKEAFYANKTDRVKQKINWTIRRFNSHCRKFKERGDYEKYKLSYILWY